MKILITGASTYGVKNLGDDAMLLTLVQQIKELIPNSEIVFICRHPSEKYDLEFGFRSIKNFDHNKREESIGRYFYGFNKGDKNEHSLKLINEFKDADLLILGGNLFMEISDNSLMRGVSAYSTLMTTIAKLFGVDIVLYGLNVVSQIKSQTTINHCKYVISNASRISLREKNALDNIYRLGIQPSNAKICGDPAWGIEVKPELNLSKSILKRNKIDLDDKSPIITVTFRLKYWNENQNDLDNYKNKLKDIFKSLHQKINASFLLIPNCTYRGVNPYQDDRFVHEEIYNFSRLNDLKYVHQINEELNIKETLSILELSNLHLSNRRHSCLFAALNGINFIMIDNIGLVDHLKPILNEVNLNDNHLNIDDSSETIVNKVLKIFKRNKEIKNQLNEKCKFLSKKAKDQVSYLLGI